MIKIKGEGIMKKIVVLVLIIAFMPFSISFSQDYGDFIHEPGGGFSAPVSLNLPQQANTYEEQTSTIKTQSKQVSKVQDAPMLSQDNIYGDYFLFAAEKIVSLDLEDANLVDVLKMLSQQTGLNFVSTEAVRDRRLTLYFQSVPLKEAMDVMMSANNLAYDYYPDTEIFVVKEMGKPTLELKTKVYTLKYSRVMSSKVEGEVDDNLGAGVGEGGGAKVGIKEAVESVLSEAGRVSEDALTNSLIVVDVPSQFPLIDEVVSKLDVPLSQVMIEVEVLDVNKNVVDKMGIAWPENLIELDMTGVARSTAFPMEGSWGNVGSGTGHGGFSASTLRIVDSELALQFLRTQTDTKDLARPKILTTSNQTAEIKLTKDEAIGVQKDIDEDGNVTWNIERTETGVRLRVTPQVDVKTGEITLFVEVVVKEAEDSEFVISDSSWLSGAIRDPEERSTKSIVRMKGGETLFIGGLIREENSNVETKVPILGDIPIIGRLFRHKHESSTERELVVFLTPRIINENSCLARGQNLFPREQEGMVKRETVRVALDRLSR